MTLLLLLLLYFLRRYTPCGELFYIIRPESGKRQTRFETNFEFIIFYCTYKAERKLKRHDDGIFIYQTVLHMYNVYKCTFYL